MDLLSKLQSEFGDAVSSTAAAKSDAVDGVPPQAVAAPRDEDAAQALVAWCGRENIAFVPRGGGTKLHIGVPPSRCDLIISTEKLTQIFDHDEGNATVQVGAGISLTALDAEVRKRGQFVPLDGVATDEPTLGGTIASNHFGASKMKYGTPRDLVTGLHAVLSDGRLVKSGAKVVKNVAGYDLNKLFIGSFGTLGLITEVTIRLRPLPACQVIWQNEFGLLEENETFHPGIAAEQQAWEIFNGPFEPTWLEVETQESLSYSVRACFEGSEAAVQLQLRKLPESLGTVPLPVSDEWEITAHLPLQNALIWQRIAIEFDAYQTFWYPTLGIVRSHFLRYVSQDQVPNIAHLRAEAEKLGGFLVVERAPSEVKTSDLVWGKPRGDFALMQKLKQSFDAANVCAPGRFIGGL